MSKVTVFADAGGGFSWHCVADNGEIVCHGESYTTERDAWRGVDDASRNLAAAEHAT